MLKNTVTLTNQRLVSSYLTTHEWNNSFSETQATPSLLLSHLWSAFHFFSLHMFNSPSLPHSRSQEGETERNISFLPRLWPGSYHFLLHLIGQNLVMWPQLTAMEAGKCFLLAGKQFGQTSILLLWRLTRKSAGPAISTWSSSLHGVNALQMTFSLTHLKEEESKKIR